jgi:hypothetical protein
MSWGRRASDQAQMREAPLGHAAAESGSNLGTASEPTFAVLYAELVRAPYPLAWRTALRLVAAMRVG